MGSIEKRIIGLALGAGAPLSLFLVFWWSSAALAIRFASRPSDAWVATAAFSGLGMGLLLDVFFLKRWVSGFYSVRISTAFAAYTAASIALIGLFMGLPLGNLALGTAAGMYIGRRSRFHGVGAETFQGNSGKAASWIAAVTGAVAFPIGILVLHEHFTTVPILDRLPVPPWLTHGIPGVLLILALCAVLSVIQRLLTRRAADLSFRL
jgi:hypothetical protein